MSRAPSSREGNLHPLPVPRLPPLPPSLPTALGPHERCRRHAMLHPWQVPARPPSAPGPASPGSTPGWGWRCGTACVREGSSGGELWEPSQSAVTPVATGLRGRASPGALRVAGAVSDAAADARGDGAFPSAAARRGRQHFRLAARLNAGEGGTATAESPGASQAAASPASSHPLL